MNFYSDISKYREKIAIVTENGEQITYDEMLKNSDEIAETILPRSLVFLVCENCYESIAAYIGFLRKKIVPVMINPKIDATMLKTLYESYRPEYIFCRTDWHTSGTEISVFGKYHLLKTENDIVHKMNSELAVLITTLGSTGSPKLVMQSYKNITSNANSIAE